MVENIEWTEHGSEWDSKKGQRCIRLSEREGLFQVPSSVPVQVSIQVNVSSSKCQILRDSGFGILQLATTYLALDVDVDNNGLAI